MTVEASKSHTMIENEILDVIMPSVSPAAWVVYSLIARKTTGWGKTWDGISYSQLREGTGIKSNTTIQNALSDLKTRGLIEIKESSNKTLPNQFRVTETVKQGVTETVKQGVTETVKQENEVQSSGVTETVKRRVTETVNTIYKRSNNINNGSQKPDPELAEWVNTLADITGMDGQINFWDLADLAEILRGGYTVDQAKAVYGPQGFWYKCHWAGKKKQKPSIGMIKKTIKEGVNWDGKIPETNQYKKKTAIAPIEPGTTFVKDLGNFGGDF